MVDAIHSSNASNSVDAMFESFREMVEKDRILKDEIAEVTHGMEYWISRMASILQKTHIFENGQDVHLKEVQNILHTEVPQYMMKLVSLISPVSYYRYAMIIWMVLYHDNFRFIIQKLCFVVTYAYFLEHEILLSRDKVAEALNMKVDPAAGFHLDIEDYLFGLLQLASELSRFSINAVVVGNSILPFKIADFLYDLDAKFRLLNLKNDGLRRRYDTLKYDVQRVEQVVYDLTIRGLKRPAEEKSVPA
uniref:Translin n=1 Tax=Setaria digitata TaxID=48799 RepID=A0A915Q7A9_9BILA